VKLLVVRHAIAVPSGTPGIADDDRPLTDDGRRKFREAARGLAGIARRPDVLLTSPLPRAAETAAIAARAWGGVEPTVEPALASGDVDAILAAVSRQPAAAMVAIVGHEPTLSALLARLVGGADPERLAFRRGGVALVDLPGPPGAGGRLVWYLRPRILRALTRA
jgi:phosphohistidine phosphatase